MHGLHRHRKIPIQEAAAAEHCRTMSFALARVRGLLQHHGSRYGYCLAVHHRTHPSEWILHFGFHTSLE